MKPTFKWFVWNGRWGQYYSILIKVSESQCETWYLNEENQLVPYNRDSSAWQNLWDTSAGEDVTQITEEDATRILIGGVNYAQPIYERDFKARSMPRVP
jgi:hypothetical protein